MDKNQIPGIFIRSVFLSCVTGIGCALITFIVFLVTDDRTLLLLGSISSVFCIGKGLTLYRIARHKQYEIIEGICYHADYPIKKPYPKIRIEQENGQSISLILDRHQTITHGHAYRFYFKRGTVPDPTESSWLQTLCTDGIIGVEEMSDNNLSYI